MIKSNKYKNIIIGLICAGIFLIWPCQGTAFSSTEDRDFLFAKQAFEDEFYDIAEDIKGHFFLLPDPDSIDVIMETIKRKHG